ncbi:RNA-binding domain-containing protein [Halobaculum rubrum]|uniref:RNA-binding domain-containing protein n=1 Tax=Halobaculum rubrum TaxID=2872158 RepID=UPI001CA46349|nr:RNA-binding domain-containing protein [Halobaculum rubrum]QZY00824.1 coaE operon protein [Halobaculum rubrum]
MTTVYSVDARIEAPVHDTEVTDRVRDAVEALFPNAEFVSEPGLLVAETHTLDDFSDSLHEQEILDTARREFERNRTDGGFTFSLKKQAAFRGVVNFAVGDPDELGEISVEVTVRSPSAEEYIDHLAPPTEGGAPVDPDRR